MGGWIGVPDSRPRVAGRRREHFDFMEPSRGEVFPPVYPIASDQVERNATREGGTSQRL